MSSQPKIGAKEVKEFRYQGGSNIATKTFTVSELISELEKYPSDMPILPAWEGIHTAITKESFSVDEITHFHEDDNCKVLVIDVNE